jgi:hypothetical protein
MSAPFKHTYQSVCVDLGLAKPSSLHSYQFPVLPDEVVVSKHTGYFIENSQIFIIEDGKCISAHGLVPIYQKSVTGLPVITGYKCDSLGFEVFLKGSFYSNQEISGVLNSDLVVRKDTLLPFEVKDNEIINICKNNNISYPLPKSEDNQPLPVKLFKAEDFLRQAG